jgi:hypothetical protein
LRLALLLALFLATPALAGLRATYTAPDSPRPLIVEVADNGDARIGEEGAGDYGLLIGGTFHVVGRGPEGRVTVARLADVGAAIDRVTPVFGDTLAFARPPRPRASLTAEAMGRKLVGGRSGTLYAIRGIDQTNREAAAEYVLSGDADLAPVGRALEMFMHASLLPGAAMLGSAAPELIEETRFIFALGTPIDAGGRFRLARVEEAEARPERFALPATPMTVDTLERAMRAGVRE